MERIPHFPSEIESPENTLDMVEDQELHEDPELREFKDEIKKNLETIPERCKQLYLEQEDLLCHIINCDDYQYLATGVIDGDKILTIVKSEGEIIGARCFRMSESDHQIKSLPGMRPDGKYSKGEENNPDHHYVQSAKIDPDLHTALQSLPRAKRHPNYAEYIPVITEEDFDYKENYITFQDPEWSKAQNTQKELYKNYMAFSMAMKTQPFERVSNQTDWLNYFYESIAVLKNRLQDSDVLRSELDEYARLHTEGGEWRTYWNTVLKSHLANEFGGLLREKMNTYPQSMLPDFAEPLRAYSKKDEFGDETEIQEFKIENETGDLAHICMAKDPQGRVFVDNFYDPRVGVSSYGTYNKILNMGLTVYKSEDYKNQSEHLPSKYVRETDSFKYTDISSFWSDHPLVKEFESVNQEQE